MKMKAIFITLNVVLGIAFLVIFLTPLFFGGGDWFAVFWGSNWPIAIIFAVTLCFIDAYFLLNWRLFHALEKEDWPAVADFLEDRILRRGWITGARVRLLLNTYLVASNTDGILALEAYLEKKRPRLIARFSMSFGIPHLLSKEPSDAEAYFRELLERPHVADRDWIMWNHAFSLLQAKRTDEARAALMDLAGRVTQPVLLLLSIYLLDVLARNDSPVESLVASTRDRLRTQHTPSSLQKAVDKAASNMQVIVLSRLLQDAAHWLFAEPPKPVAAGETVH